MGEVISILRHGVPRDRDRFLQVWTKMGKPAPSKRLDKTNHSILLWNAPPQLTPMSVGFIGDGQIRVFEGDVLIHTGSISEFLSAFPT